MIGANILSKDIFVNTEKEYFIIYTSIMLTTDDMRRL